MHKIKKFIIKYDFLLIGLLSFIYYVTLSAKEFTWMFVSGDSGDWLAASSMWFVPQPYGSPLYIVLGHLINTLPVDLVLGMTVGLSVIPASITVSITYLIVKRLFNFKLAIVSCLVLLSSAIFLSQSTILEEYAIATMFLTIALYCYILDKKKLVLLFLGLGSAVHIIIVAISGLWLLMEWSRIKQWYKSFWIYFIVGILPYSLILILMILPTPRWLVGELSLANLNSYLGSSGTIGSLSIYEAPKRILQFAQLIIVSLGLGIIPFILGFRKPWTNELRILIVTVIFTMWLYVTNIDPSTWTFMCFSIPMMTVLIAYGLNKVKLQVEHINFISYVAIILIITNSIVLNANTLTNQYSLATQFEVETKALPDGSCIVNSSGGQYGLGLLYIISQGKDIVPLYYSGEDYDKDARYQSYIKYIDDAYGIQGSNVIEQIEDAFSQGKEVYIVKQMLRPEWNDTFIRKEIDSKFFDKVIAVNNVLPEYESK